VTRIRVLIPDLGGTASCTEADPDAWFPEKGHRATDARATCNRCEVIDACLQWALDHDEPHGIWGGLNPEERKKLRRFVA
jgi:WhiB family transcriptional regulator, redox-sensing transcriptional regulator